MRKHIVLSTIYFFILGHSSCTDKQAIASNSRTINPKENHAIAFQKLEEDFCTCTREAMDRGLDAQGSLVSCNFDFFISTNKNFEALEKEILKSMPDSSTIKIDHIIYQQILMESFGTCVKENGFRVGNKEGLLNFLQKIKENPTIELEDVQISNIQYEHTYEIFQKIKSGHVDSIANEFEYVRDFNNNRDTLVLIQRLIKGLKGKYLYEVDSTEKNKTIYITQAFDFQSDEPICEIRYEYHNKDIFPKVKKVTLIANDKMNVKQNTSPLPR